MRFMSAMHDHCRNAIKLEIYSVTLNPIKNLVSRLAGTLFRLTRRLLKADPSEQ